MKFSENFIMNRLKYLLTAIHHPTSLLVLRLVGHKILHGQVLTEEFKLGPLQLEVV